MSVVLSQIPCEALVEGRYYVGRGRNGNVGLWNGEYFLVISRKPRFGVLNIKQEQYFTEHGGCFQPFREIDEGKTEASAANDMDALRGYAITLLFNS